MVLRTRAQWWGVTLDAPGDVRELARFYSRLLDWQLIEDGTGDSASVAPSRYAGYYLGFQTETSYVRPVWPAKPGQPQMSIHLEIQVDDLDEALAHAVSVGAEVAAHQPQPTVRVLLDPAGHPRRRPSDRRRPSPGRGRDPYAVSGQCPAPTSTHQCRPATGALLPGSRSSPVTGSTPSTASSRSSCWSGKSPLIAWQCPQQNAG